MNMNCLKEGTILAQAGPGVALTVLKALEDIGIKGIFGTNGVNGIQCSVTIKGIMDTYESCLERPNTNSSGCARIAARHIKEYACRSYCTCE